jgi:transcriptional regulator with XRE-family HTH domain
LAQKLGLTRATISKYENITEQIEGFRTLVAMSELFDVPVDYILGLTDCRERYPAPEPIKEVMAEQLFKDLPDEAKKAATEYLNMLKKKHPPK